VRGESGMAISRRRPRSLGHVSAALALVAAVVVGWTGPLATPVAAATQGGVLPACVPPAAMGQPPGADPAVSLQAGQVIGSSCEPHWAPDPGPATTPPFDYVPTDVATVTPSLTSIPYTAPGHPLPIRLRLDDLGTFTAHPPTSGDPDVTVSAGWRWDPASSSASHAFVPNTRDTWLQRTRLPSGEWGPWAQPGGGSPKAPFVLTATSACGGSLDASGIQLDAAPSTCPFSLSWNEAAPTADLQIAFPIELYWRDSATGHSSTVAPYTPHSWVSLQYSASVAPTAGITYRGTGTANEFQFTSTSVAAPDQTITRYDWDFGDGTTLADGPASPIHEYATEAATRTVTLKVTDSAGLTDTASVTLAPRLTIAQAVVDPEVPTVGHPAQLRITLRNDGPLSITSAAASASSTTPDVMSVGGVPTPAASDLRPGESADQTFELTPIAAGTASLSISAAGTAGAATLHAGPVTRTVAVQAADLLVTLDPPIPARPGTGEPFTIVAHITNPGDLTLTDVHPVGPLGADPPAGVTTSSPSPANVSALAPGGSADLTYGVTSTIGGGLTLSLAVTGTDPDGQSVTSPVTERTLTIGSGSIVVTTAGDEPLSTQGRADHSCDVDPNADGEQCTLRAAIELADILPDPAVHIGFAIPMIGVPHLTPATDLPDITATVTVDGRSQPGGLVEISGPGTATGTGLRLQGHGSTVAGLVVNGFDVGVDLAGSGDHHLIGNRIGTDPSGLSPRPNAVGVFLRSPHNTIGGVTGTSSLACTGDCNLLAGNSQAQVTNIRLPEPTLPVSAAVTIQGNWVGVDAQGSSSVPADHSQGIVIWVRTGDALPATDSVVIGGASARPGTAPGNVIAAPNGAVIVDISDVSPKGRVQIAGNLVGLDAGGSRRLAGPVPTVGIVVGNRGLPTDHVVVGGQTPAMRNVLGGAEVGVETTSAIVQGNRIGTDIDGTAAVANDLGLQQLGGGWASDNLISGNNLGVSGSTVDLVAGNVIGLAANGHDPLPNNVGIGGPGVLDIYVGQTGTGASCSSLPCNVVSGNTTAGIQTSVNYALRLSGTFIGTDITGRIAVPNGKGVDIAGPPVNTVAVRIGGPTNVLRTGTCSYPCNVVAGNSGPGIHVVTTDAPDFRSDAVSSIAGNLLGVSIDGAPLPNGGPAVEMAGVDANPLVIGGDLASGNIIASTGSAIQVDGAGAGQPRLTVATDRFQMLGTAPPIVGPTTPVPSVLSSAVVEGASVALKGSTFGVVDPLDPPETVEVYASATCGGQREPVGSTPADRLTGDFELEVPAGALAGRPVLSLLRTDQLGRTSRFGPCFDGPVVTTVSRAAPAGATEVAVESNAGFAPGDYARLATDPGVVRRIDALGSLVFAAPLPADVAQGTVVIRIPAPAGDTSAPAITVHAPLPNATVVQGAVVPVDVTCTDDGVGVEECRHPATLDTAAVGEHELVVTAWDRNGNLATSRVAYTVIAPVGGVTTSTTPVGGATTTTTTSTPGGGGVSTTTTAPASGGTTPPDSTPVAPLPGSGSGSGANPAGGSAPASATGTLVRTGVDSPATTALGVALLVVGAVLVLSSRRRRGQRPVG